MFGRELQALSEQLGREYGKNLAHTEMLQVIDKPDLHTEQAPFGCQAKVSVGGSRRPGVGQNGSQSGLQ